MERSSDRIVLDTMRDRVENLIMDIVLSDKTRSKQIQRQGPETREAIHNMYKLPSTEYADKLLTDCCWISIKGNAAMKAGNYATWLIITVKNINEFFPESAKTQKGHMRQAKEGVQSTKTVPTS